MEKENTINCPNCGTEIDVNDVAFHQVEERLKTQFAEQSRKKDEQIQNEKRKIQDGLDALKKDQEDFDDKVSSQVQDRLKVEKATLQKNIETKLKSETADQIESLQKELNEKSVQVKELNKAKAEIEKVKREKDELRSTIELEFQKLTNEKLLEGEKRIKKDAEEATTLKLKEREKVIEDLTEKLKDAQKRAEQGSMQLQGEVQELELESMLKEMYPMDEITEVKKGQRGADCLQIIRNQIGGESGKIYYESKRAKNFDKGWLQKLRDDNLNVKADILVLVTESMPDGEEKFIYRDGIWICSLWEVKALSLVLRQGLQQLHTVMVTNQGRETKMEMLYNYLTSQEFNGQFNAIMEGFKGLQDSYHDEKLKMQKVWKEREKQLEKILTNAVSFYGSIKGIGGSAIQDIKMLEEKTID